MMMKIDDYAQPDFDTTHKVNDVSNSYSNDDLERIDNEEDEDKNNDNEININIHRANINRF